MKGIASSLCKFFCLLACVIRSSCLSSSADEKFIIVTTTGILGDAIKHIVQEDAQVISLMGPGIDPHTYQTTPKDVQQLRHAHMIFYNGLDLEGKMSSLLKEMAKERPIYAVSDALHPTQLIHNGVLGIDPHFWHSVALWQQGVRLISQILQAARPTSAAYYQANTVAYLKVLEALHQSVTAQIQSIPKQQRVLVTTHDAFGYFGKAYDIEVVGLQGISTVAECGLLDIKRMVSFIIERNIQAVFFEASVSDRSMRAVLEGCVYYGHQVKIGGALYSDALGAPDTAAGSYYGMVRYRDASKATEPIPLWERLQCILEHPFAISDRALFNYFLW